MPPYPRDNHPYRSIPTDTPEEFGDSTEKTTPEVNATKEDTLHIVWRNVAIFTVLHTIALYGLYLSFTSAKLATVMFSFLTYHIAAFGITGGAHRLWAHRSYKATLPLRVLLVFCETMAHQNSVIEWARDHRVHHKFQETDADPHNAVRGFFFSHMGWLLCKKHQEVKEKGKRVDLSDLYSDPLLRFQKKYFIPLMLLACFVFPTVLPMLIWKETFMNAYSLNILRYVCSLHATWLVNSAAHKWGAKPYDTSINATETIFVSIFSTGEGWHNYHHTFPWDYKAAEFGRVNLTMWIINQFAKIGWAYDLKTVSKDMIKYRVERTGDGSHEIWGWGDRDQTPENYNSAVIYNKKDE